MEEKKEIIEEAVDATTETANLAKAVMQEKDMKKVSATQKAVKIGVQIALYAFLGFMALVVLFPFYWMLISSVKSMTEYEMNPPTLWPQFFIWKNYR